MKERWRRGRRLLVGLAVAWILVAPGLSPAQTLVYLARHGETEANSRGILQGQSDSLLTAAGRAQADRLAAFLSERNIQAIYSSSLGRALETARRTGQATGLAIQPLDELREIGLGRIEGKELTDPAVRQEFERVGIQIDYRPEGGESFSALAARAGRALELILRKHQNQTVAIVAHGMINRAILSHLLSLPLPEAAALPSQPHGRIYVIYKLSASPGSLLWEDLPPEK